MVSRRSRLVALMIALAWLISIRMADADRRVNDGSSIRPKCRGLVAETANDWEVKLVGIVERGRTRHILFLVRGKGYLVGKSECVGRAHVPYEDMLAQLLANHV